MLALELPHITESSRYMSPKTQQVFYLNISVAVIYVTNYVPFKSGNRLPPCYIES